MLGLLGDDGEVGQHDERARHRRRLLLLPVLRAVGGGGGGVVGGEAAQHQHLGDDALAAFCFLQSHGGF